MCACAGILGFEKAVDFSIGESLCGWMGMTGRGEEWGGHSRDSPLPHLPQCRGKKGQVCTRHSSFSGGSLPTWAGSGDPTKCKSLLQGGAVCAL